MRSDDFTPDEDWRDMPADDRQPGPEARTGTYQPIPAYPDETAEDVPDDAGWTGNDDPYAGGPDEYADDAVPEDGDMPYDENAPYDEAAPYEEGDVPYEEDASYEEGEYPEDEGVDGDAGLTPDAPVQDDATHEKHSMFRPTERKPRFVLSVAVNVIRILLVIIVLGGLAAVGAVVGIARGYVETCPTLDLADLSGQAQTSFIYDCEGNLITEYKGTENRVMVSIASMPRLLQYAFVAV